MKKAGQLLAVLTAASVLLSGCEKLKDVTTTSVYVSKNGVVTEAIVEDYSKDDDYTEDELKVFVEDDIKKFTEERGDADSVKLEKCQIKEDKVEIQMEYGDYQSYADYHGAEFFAGTLDEAEEAGYDFSASFVDSKGNEVSVEDAVKGVKHVRVIVCEEPLEIVTEDPVLAECAAGFTKSISTVTGCLVCVSDQEQIVAANGPEQKNYLGKSISSRLEEAILNRKTVLARPGEKAYFSILENTDNTTPLPELIFPILSSGDAIGSVILCGKDRESLPGDTEKKLLQVAATYLGREMEN